MLTVQPARSSAGHVASQKGCGPARVSVPQVKASQVAARQWLAGVSQSCGAPVASQPAAGALGAVDESVLRQIVEKVVDRISSR